jgi:uncharacterized protein
LIIDVHTHIWDKDWRPPWNEDSVIHAMAHALNISYTDAQAKLYNSWDPTADKTVAEMDKNGVDIALVNRIDYGMVIPGAENDCRVPLEEQCRLTAQAAKRHEGRLIWGMGIDPRRPGALKLVDLCLGQLGAKCIKFYPPGGFYPNDKIMYPIYEKAVEYDAVVDFHMMPVSEGPMRSKYCHPLFFEDVAVDFPKLKIMATHGGGPLWYREMLAVVQDRSNIYLNVAGWQHERRYNAVGCYRKIREMMNRVGPKRIMWASDWEGPGIYPQRSWLKAFQEIPLEVKEAGIEFTESEIKAFLGESAAEFLGLLSK